MDRDAIVLAALAAAGENATFTPVQVQKLFFVLDREASHLTDGPHFSFKAYDYGPFDRTVYDTLDALKALSKADVQNSGRYRSYSLSQSGFQEGNNILKSLPNNAKNYIQELASWIKAQNFEQLVSSIYQRYPEMKANSVFRG